MDFSLSADHKEFQEWIRGFASRDLDPGISEADRNCRFDKKILARMGELGILGHCLPEKYNGGGLDYISLGLASEELEYTDTAYREILSVHIALFCLPLLSWGTDELKNSYLPKCAAGEKIGCFGLTEPDAGSDVVGIQSHARREGGHYILNGQKMWISLADVADYFIVFAWTDLEKKKARDHSGMSAFLLERCDPGISTGSIHGKLGVRAGNTGWVSMDDVKIPADRLVGNEGEGFKIAMFGIDQGRYTVAAGSAGLIRACLDSSVKYAKERHTFKVPTGRHQLVKQMIAGMVESYEITRLLYLKAGWMKNEGLRCTLETSIAKRFACEAAEKSASNAVQIHGAYGFSDEYPVERHFRNCKAAQIYEGAREIHTIIQADYALGLREDKPLRRNLPPWPFER
ncbi:MAG: acyl-CoA dehydrogenase family protein [Chloroflexi bacterium]|nr:acyl-CoA dehydrogenase family protein [Chloroflexota bacterium]